MMKSIRDHAHGMVDEMFDTLATVGKTPSNPDQLVIISVDDKVCSYMDGSNTGIAATIVKLMIALKRIISLAGEANAPSKIKMISMVLDDVISDKPMTELRQTLASLQPTGSTN